ncbi:hypothetical protein GCM10023094_48480 [Rhodococcus olei]|uniref:Transmembrane protein n=2 Tax=Rhodococcus olei TaxID=2161675 RepID=A0ABP8PLI2_9NOCA
MGAGRIAPLRMWRLAPWSPNRLMRGGDRFESAAVLVAIAVVLTLIPFAATFGTATYTRLSDQADLDRATHTEVTAALVEDAELAPIPVTPGESAVQVRGPARAHAQWTVNGADHAGTVVVGPSAKAGQAVDIWVDTNGTPVAAPKTGGASAAVAVVTAVALWTMAAWFVSLLVLGVHWVGTKQRLMRWDREWRDLGTAPGWSVG